MRIPSSTAALTLILALTGAAAAQNAPSQRPSASPAVLSPAGEGRRLFLKLNCYSCHGMHGAGGMGPTLQGGIEFQNLQDITLNGSEEGMISFAHYVSNKDLLNINAYLGTLGTPAEPTFDHWWEPVPSK